MTDERFEEFLRNALDELEPVPAPPREAMWAQIDEARRFGRRAEQARVRRVRLQWGVGLAAMLVLGIGIGRMTTLQRAGVQTSAPTAAVTNVTPNPTTYQVAINQHLNRAEVLLTSFRTQPAAAAADPQLAVLARELLSSTQLLLDSPAADDARVAALLSDLELILAQIARLSAPSAEEREIIQDGLNRTAVLPRLRATTAGTPAAGT